MEPRAGEMAQHATNWHPSGSQGPDAFFWMCAQPHTNEWLRNRMNQELNHAVLLSEVLNIIHKKSREGLGKSRREGLSERELGYKIVRNGKRHKF